MEKIVYLLGAGFSAPLGLPVMSNFYIKSKDMYYENPNKYPHFQEVFDTIDQMSVIKNYYSADLLNIEEILSILEMGEYIIGKQLKNTFLQYIIDVIRYHTPEIKPHPRSKLPSNWYDWLFGTRQIWESYGRFIANICNVHFKLFGVGFTGNYEDISCGVSANPKYQYSIITLNYDLVPEMIVQFLNDNYEDANVFLNIAKIHGCVDKGNIVPPTWSKGVNTQIVPAWNQAYKLLNEANHLRIIGYSLPTADAYVKYLLKSAVIKAPHFKKIDVICLDDRNQTAKQRYDEFIPFGYYRFVNASVAEYLEIVKSNNNVSSAPTGGKSFVLDKLENAHEAFFYRYS